MEDRTLLASFLVINTDNSGRGSLRQAILDSDAATGGTNTIDFDIPGSGVQTIVPLSALPAITHSVLIDGFSQPGYGETPLIELSGNQAGGGDGLTIKGPDVTVRGLDINGFSQGAGIRVTGTGATGDWVYGNFLGTDPTGKQALPNYIGVQIDAGATGNLVGTNGDGVNDASERNLISGNQFAGVWITGQSTSRNAVAGNWIGTDISGSGALDNGTQPVIDSIGNTFGGGVAISAGASGNRIGTDGKSVDDVGERNVIAGSDNDAIDIYGTGTDGNVVAGNFIGTDRTGKRSLGIADDGVLLAEGASSNWIGVNPNGGSAADQGNVISGTGYDGVQIGYNSNSNVVAGNKIGTNVSGTAALGNASSGVEVDAGCIGNTIGGTTADARDVISGNGADGDWDGVDILGSGAIGNVVEGDYIGTDVSGTQRLGNFGDGVDISDASNNTIGGTTAGARNVISGNAQDGGIHLRQRTTGNLVAGNYIGSDVTGTKVLGNAYSGVKIADSASKNTIGGTAAGDGNVISGNGRMVTGIVLTSLAAATGNVVEGNYIGTDVTGTHGLGNVHDGVDIGDASNNTIGGTTAGPQRHLGQRPGRRVHLRQHDGQPGRGQLHRHRRDRYEGPGKRVLRRQDRR